MTIEEAKQNIKDGFVLNPNEKAVNGIINMCNNNNGDCPCSTNKSRDKHCPCSDYRENNVCTCRLYIKTN